MSFSPRVGVVLVAVAATAAAGLWFWSQSGDRDAAGEAAPDAPAAHEETRSPDQAADRATDLTCRFEAGQAMAWRVETRDQVTVDPTAFEDIPVDGEAQQTDYRTRATLHAFVMTVTPADEAILMGRLTGFQAEPAAEGDTWTTGVEDAFLLRVGPRCDVLAKARHKDTHVLSHLRVEGIIDGLRFAVPSSPGGELAGLPLEDSYGQLLATVTHVPGAGRGSLQVQPTGYHQADAEGMAPRIEAARGDVVLAEAVWFEQLEMKQHTVLWHQARPAFDSRSERHFEATVTDPDALVGQPTNLGEYLWGNVPQHELLAAHATGEYGWLEGVSHDDAWRYYVEMRDSGAPGAWFEAQHLMRAWMALNPEGVRQLAAAMRAGELDESATSQLVLAMAKSGSPVAAEELRSMASEPTLRENLRVQATSAMADLHAPTAEDVQALEALANRSTGSSENDMVGSAATMSMGSLLRDHPGYDAVAEPAREYLGGVLQASDPVRVSEALYAVGNSGDESFLPQVTQLMGSDEARVRAASAASTRRMSRRATQDALSDLLREEPSAQVVDEIARAHQDQLSVTKGRLTERELSLYQTKLPSAPVSTRMEIIRVLGQVADRQPRAAQILATWFPLEQDTGLRAMIGRFLSAEQLRQ